MVLTRTRTNSKSKSTKQKNRRIKLSKMSLFGVIFFIAGFLIIIHEVGSKEAATNLRAQRGIHRVGIIGSGNFGTAMAKIVGQNLKNLSSKEEIDSKVEMWVFEEEIDGQKLTEIINERHENVKYLPGVSLPDNVVANPDLAAVAAHCDLLVFVLPEQFLPRTLSTMKPHIKPGARAISLIKGLQTGPSGEPVLISNCIKEELGIDCSVLMGANLAVEVAQGHKCEATIGCTDMKIGETFKKIFQCPTYRVSVQQDVAGVELCGCLKNIVALGAGFCDGIGAGANTKAALVRQGLIEMMRFCKMFYDGVQDSTFFESCGIADLIVTCYGGRNRRCAEEFAKQGGNVAWEDLEETILNGQKLAGTQALKAVHAVLAREQALDRFPVFKMINHISFEGTQPSHIIDSIV